MYSFFERSPKLPSALQEREQELQKKKDAKWAKGTLHFNRLPKDLLFSYVFVDKKISFDITGGYQRNKLINFQAEDKDIYDEFALCLADKEMNIKDVSNETLNQYYYAFNLTYSNANDIKIFLEELGKRFPFSDEIQQTILAVAKPLNSLNTQENEHSSNSSMNFELIAEKVERLKRKANKLLDSISDLQEELESSTNLQEQEELDYNSDSESISYRM